MAAMMLRVGVWVRRRHRRLLLTALLIGVTAGLVIGLAAGTRRTSSAPDRFTARAGGDPDLVVTQFSGAPLTEQIAGVPGVADAGSVVFVTSFLVSPADGSPVFEPNPFAGDDRLVGARVVEGRFTDPGAPSEFTVNRDLFSLLDERFGARVGDEFQVTSFDQQQVESNVAFGSGEVPAVPLFTATLVGVTEAPSDFDESSPSMIFSQSFLAAHPTVGVVQTIVAVRLDEGTDPEMVLDAVRALPNGGDAFAVPSRIISEDARRAVRFQVTAFWLVTAIAAIAALVVVSLLVGRMVGTVEDERSSLLAIGWRHGDLAAERAIEGGVIALVAAPVASVIGFLLTALFPLGVLRSFDPESGPRVDWLVVMCGVIATTAVVVTSAALAGRRRARRADGDRRLGTVFGLIATSSAGMPLTTAARLTASVPSGARRSAGSFAAGVVGLAGLVGSGVVGLTMTHIVDQPARWGVNFDGFFGNPYIAAEDDIVTPLLDSPDVVAVTGANIGSLTINGLDTALLAIHPVKGDLLPITLEGHPPLNDDEIGLGAEVARRLGVGVGDDVDAVGPNGAFQVFRVVGIVVTPDNAGNGAAMTFDAYASLSPTATENVVFVEFRHGAPDDVASRLGAAFSPPDALTTPTSVRALQRVTAAPFVLGLVLTVLLVVASAYLLATAVRARRRDLAILRALGSNGRQLRAVVHWQATLVTALTLLVGLPAGIVLGRWVVELVTDALGIVPGAEVPALLVLAVPVVGIAVANLLAVVPARRAARTPIGELMRDR